MPPKLLIAWGIKRIQLACLKLKYLFLTICLNAIVLQGQSTSK